MIETLPQLTERKKGSRWKRHAPERSGRALPE
jgi:hypothetical protein